MGSVTVFGNCGLGGIGRSVGLMMGISSVLVMEFSEVISPLTMTGQATQ